MAKVEIYTKDWCPYCVRAQRLLAEGGAEVVEYKVDMGGEKKAEMIQRAGGRTTVPQIFIDEQYIGGCDDLFDLHRSGKLADLLTGIRAANPRAADDVEDAVRRTLERLEANPLSGSRHRVRNPNLGNLRSATVSHYPQFVVLYLPTAGGVEVLHIVRGRRNLSRVVADD